MFNIIKEKKFIEILEETGLSYNEALVYFALIKSGKKGSIVKELDHELPIKRTNIYSILNKLMKLGYVEEAGQAEKSKNATIFISFEPKKFINHLIEKKKIELNKLIKIKDTYSNDLQTIYQEGMQFTFDELDQFIQPYFKPLLKKGWKIKSYVVRSGMPMFHYEVYDCMLYSPKSKYIKDNSFHLFIFDYDIESDENALTFFINSLKKKTREMKSFFFDIKEFKLIDDKMSLSHKTYPVFKMEVKIEQLKNSVYFENISNQIKEKNSEEYYEIGKAVIIPIGNKLFYLWAETDGILKEMAAPIFMIN
ncbi:MAG: helix-turn-helix domain-containing protein [Promethearchaeota archaeon]